MAARLPRAVHAAIPDAGHICNVDQPELFNQQVLAFLDQPDLRLAHPPGPAGGTPTR